MQIEIEMDFIRTNFFTIVAEMEMERSSQVCSLKAKKKIIFLIHQYEYRQYHEMMNAYSVCIALCKFESKKM